MTQRLLDKPTAEQVFMFTHVIGQNPRTDRNEAYSVLQQWMDGTLEVEVADAHTTQPRDAAACALCIAGCGVFLGIIDPVCLAICLAGPCK